jgi:hypothetical protein
VFVIATNVHGDAGPAHRLLGLKAEASVRLAGDSGIAMQDDAPAAFDEDNGRAVHDHVMVSKRLSNEFQALNFAGRE